MSTLCPRSNRPVIWRTMNVSETRGKPPTKNAIRIGLLPLAPRSGVRGEFGRLKHLGVAAAGGQGAAVLVQPAHGAVVAEADELRLVTAHRRQFPRHYGGNVLDVVVLGQRGPHLVGQHAG